MASKCRCSGSGIFSLLWDAYEIPATSSVSLKSLVGKDLGAINLNWFEECGDDISCTEAPYGNFKYSLLPTDVETVSKDEVTKTVEVVTDLPIPFPTEDVSDHSRSHSSLFGDNFYGAALSLSKSSHPASLYDTESIVCNTKCVADISFSYQTLPVNNEKISKAQCTSPDTNNPLEPELRALQSVEVKDPCNSGKSRQLIWSPVTQQEESPQMRFPAFETPHSYQNVSSTPRHLTLSLGIDPNDSDLKWSPSMETPTLPSQSKKLHSMITPDQNSVVYDVKDQAHHSPFENRILSGNFSASGSSSNGSSNCSPKCKDYRKKPALRRLSRLSKKKARQLFHGRVKDDHRNSSCHRNKVNEANISSVCRNDTLCLSSELNIGPGVPVLQQNISNALEFLFATPSDLEEIRRPSEPPFCISFQCEEFVRHALFYPGKRALLCDVRLIDMNKYLPNVCISNAVDNCSVDASESDAKTGLHLSKVAYVPQTVFENNDSQIIQNTVQQGEIKPETLLSYFKSRISESVLKGICQSYSLLNSLQGENGYSVSSFPNHDISYSQFSISGTVVLNDTQNSKSCLFCDMDTSESCRLHHTAVSITKSSESCLCVQYKWEVPSKGTEYSTCSGLSGSLPKHMIRNLNCASQSPGSVSDFDRRENFQMCLFEGHFANSLKAFLPERSTISDQLGMSSRVIYPEFGNTVVKITNGCETGVVKMKVKNIQFNARINNPFSVCDYFCSGITSDIMNHCSSVLIDFPLLRNPSMANHGDEFQTNRIKNYVFTCNKGLDMPFDQHTCQICCIDADNSVERNRLCTRPVEIFEENQIETPQNIQLKQLSSHAQCKYDIVSDVAVTEPNCKPSEVLCSTQCLLNGVWTQSLDKMDSVLAGIPSQVYACSKPCGVTDSSSVPKETEINECIYQSNFSSVVLRASANKGDRMENSKFLVDSSLPSECSGEGTFNGGCEINLAGNENIFLQENIPSQFFRLSESSFNVSLKTVDEKCQVKLTPGSQNEIKMTDSVNFLVDSCIDSKTSTGNNIAKTENIVHCSPVGLNISGNSSGTDANLYLLQPSECSSNFRNVFNSNFENSTSISHCNLQHKPTSTNITFGVVDKNVNTSCNQKRDMYLIGGTFSGSATRTGTMSSLKIFVPSHNNSKMDNELSESCAPNFTEATTDTSTYVPRHGSMNVQQMVSTKPSMCGADPKYHSYNQNFYSCLSQDDQNDANIVPFVSNATVSDDKCTGSKHVLYDNSDLKSIYEQFNDSHDSVKHLPVEMTDVSVCKTQFPDQIEESFPLKDNGPTHIIHQQGRDPNQLPKGILSHDALYTVNSVFIDQDAKKAANPSKRFEGKSILEKDRKIAELEVNDNTLCEAEARFENKEQFHPQIDFSGFKTASEKSIKVSDETFHQAVAMFNQVCCDLPSSEKVVCSISNGPKIVSEPNLETGKEAVCAATKRKMIEADYGTENNVNFSSASGFGFQTASGKKLKISVEALKMAKEKFDEISSCGDSVNDELFIFANVGSGNICGIPNKGSEKKSSNSNSDCHGIEGSGDVECKRSRMSVENDYAPDVYSFEKENHEKTVINSGNQLKMMDGTLSKSLGKQGNKPRILENTIDRMEMKPDKKDIDYETQFLLLNTTDDVICNKVKLLLPDKQEFDDMICKAETVTGNTFSITMNAASGQKIKTSNDDLGTAKGNLTEIGLDDRNAGDGYLNSKFSTSFESEVQISPGTSEFAAKMLDVSFGSEVTPTVACAAPMQDDKKSTLNVENLRKLPDLSVVPSENSCKNEHQITSENQMGYAADAHCLKNVNKEYSSEAESVTVTNCKTSSPVMGSHGILIKNEFLLGDFPQGGGVNDQKATSRGSKRKLCDTFSQSGGDAEGMESVSRYTYLAEEQLRGVSTELNHRKCNTSDDHSGVVLRRAKMECEDRSGKRVAVETKDNAFQGDVHLVDKVLSDTGQNNNILCKEVLPTFKSSLHGLEAENKRKELHKEEHTVISDIEKLDEGACDWIINMKEENKEQEPVTSAITNVLPNFVKDECCNNITCISVENYCENLSFSSVKMPLTPVANSEMCKAKINSPKISVSGVQTVVGGQVQVSKQMMEEASKQFEEMCTDLNISGSVKIEPMENITRKLLEKSSTTDGNSEKSYSGIKSREPFCKGFIPGFQTAANQEVNFSEGASHVVKGIFKDAKNESDFHKSKGSSYVNISGSGHQTTSSITIYDEVSQETLKTTPSKKLEIPFCGFQTASGAQIKISENALNAAKKKLESVFADSEFSKTEENTHNRISSGNHSATCCEVFQETQISSFKKEAKELKLCTPVFQKRNSDEPLSTAKRKFEEASIDLELSNPKKSGHAKISGFRLQTAKANLEMGRSQMGFYTASFPAFQTASGEKVRVSKQALDAAKKKFQAHDSEFCDLNEVSSADPMTTAKKKEVSSISSKVKFPVFQTAAGEEVRVSEQALDAARKKFQDSEFCDLNEVPSADPMMTAKKKEVSLISSKIKFPMFQTAAGEEVSVSKQSLDAARKKFQTHDSEFCDLNEVSSVNPMMTAKEMEVSSISSKIKFPMFQTAAGEEVSVSKQSLDAARKKFQAHDSECCDLNEVPSADPMMTAKKKEVSLISSKIKFPMFQTAAGEEVSISKQSLDAARKKFQAHDSEFCDLNEVSSVNPMMTAKEMEVSSISSKIKFPMFQTAAGEEVSVSKQSLDAARKKFQTHDSEFCDLNEVSSVNPMMTAKEMEVSSISSKIKFPVFQTAAGEEVSVSKQALDAARKKFQAHDSECCDLNEVPSADPVMTAKKKEVSLISSKIKFPMFQTAAGEEVSVSEQALDAARKRFQAHDSEFCDLNEVPSVDLVMTAKKEEVFSVSSHKITLPMFQTAAGNAVNISEKAFSAAKKKLEKMSESECHSSERIISGNTATAEIHIDENCEINILGKELGVLEKKTALCKVSGFKSVASNKIHISEYGSDIQMAEHAEVHINNQEIKRETPHRISGDPLAQSSLSATDKMKHCVSDCSDNDLFHEIGEVFLCKSSSVCPKPFIEKESPGQFAKQELLISGKISGTQINSGTRQKKGIKNKSKGGVIPGKMWFLKSGGSGQQRMTYRKCVGNSLPGTYTSEELLSFGVKKSTLSLTSKNAGDFVFGADDHFSSEASSHCRNIIIGDSASLMLDANFCAGKEMFYRAFLTVSGVSSNLISKDWFYNHYRWVILKLASMEVSFPKLFGGRCLLPEQLMLQMKWRYDCEIDNGMRSALRKILERDDLSTKTLILFVSHISLGESSKEASEDNKETNISISLSDGWYEVPAQIDAAMCQLVKQRKVLVGQKLIISGAELVGSDAACSPLEIPAGLKLKVNTNSSRRARWDSKLGYFKDPRPFLVPLSSLVAEGGCVSCVEVVVMRVYPITFMEKYQDGSTTLRNERLENVVAERHQKLKQSCLEKLAIEVEKSIEEKGSWRKQQRAGKVPKPVTSLSSGSEIYQVMQMANDPESIQSQLNSSQMRMLSQFLRKKQEENSNNFAAQMKDAISEAQQQGRFPCDRVVTPLMKVIVKGFLASEKNENGVILTIWRPSENIFSFLAEGKVLRIYYLSVSRGKASELQLSSNKATRYEEVVADEEKINSVFIPRQVMSLGEIKNATCSGILQDVDVVGVVIHITPEMNTHGCGSCQLVYIADAEFCSLAIRFWNGVASLGFQDFLQVGKVISACNLKIDTYLDDSLPRATATVLTVFSTNPKGAYLQAALQNLKTKVLDVNSFVQKAKEHLQPKFDTPQQKFDKPSVEAYPVLRKQFSNSKSFRGPSVDVRGSKMCNFQSPKPYPMYSPVTRSRDNVVPRRCRLVDRNAVGLQTELGNGNKLAVDTTDTLPSLSSKTKERIAALEVYGCLPPVNALPVKISPAATKSYKSPRINSPLIPQQKLYPGSTEKSTGCKQSFSENRNVKNNS